MAVQVRVMTVGHVPAEVSVKLTGTVVSQLSVAVTLGAAGIPSHSTVSLAGTPTSSGSTVSTTVIVCTQVAVLPQPSVVVHVRAMT